MSLLEAIVTQVMESYSSPYLRNRTIKVDWTDEDGLGGTSAQTKTLTNPSNQHLIIHEFFHSNSYTAEELEEGDVAVIVGTSKKEEYNPYEILGYGTNLSKPLLIAPGESFYLQFHFENSLAADTSKLRMSAVAVMSSSTFTVITGAESEEIAETVSTAAAEAEAEPAWWELLD